MGILACRALLLPWQVGPPLGISASRLQDMLRTIEFGTQNSRHLPFKFPPWKYPNVHLAGLYPSIAGYLGLANDVSEKRPLNNKFAKRRLEFLSRYNLIDERDIETWRRNKTYELEALSTAFKNDKGEPIGLGIYLIEYFRLFNIPIKPPLPPDDELKRLFEEAAHEELKREIREALLSDNEIFWIMYRVRQEIEKYRESIVDMIYNKVKDELDKVLEQVTVNAIKYWILKQYEEDPTRKEYDYAKIAHMLKKKFIVQGEIVGPEIEDKLKELVKQYFEENKRYSADIKFEPIHNESKQPDIYDVILRHLGAKEEDVLKIRKALEWRFNGHREAS